MAKVYLVIHENKKKIFYSWEECQQFVHGRSNVLFKGFKNEALALDFFKEHQSKNEEKKSFPMEVYTDGSFDLETKKGSWAFVAIQSDAIYFQDSGVLHEEPMSRNIDGEIHAVLEACQWMDKERLEGISLHFDYIGIERWAKKEWQAKTEISKFYIKNIEPYLHRLNFKKVPAHQGLKWNEYVDELAKSAIKK